MVTQTIGYVCFPEAHPGINNGDDDAAADDVGVYITLSVFAFGHERRCMGNNVILFVSRSAFIHTTYYYKHTRSACVHKHHPSQRRRDRSIAFTHTLCACCVHLFGAEMLNVLCLCRVSVVLYAITLSLFLSPYVCLCICAP